MHLEEKNVLVNYEDFGKQVYILNTDLQWIAFKT